VEVVSYQNYVIAAYCVFAVVLAWDYVAPRVQLREQRRAASLRAARVTARPADVDMELKR
jgi:heme exporter protein D